MVFALEGWWLVRWISHNKNERHVIAEWRRKIRHKKGRGLILARASRANVANHLD